jgi:hypothetical protein
VARTADHWETTQETAWALIAHERLADADPDDGFFSSRSAARDPGIAQRAAAFARKGRAMKP